MSRYPSSVFQAALLQEHGFQVVVCDISDGGYGAFTLPKGVERRIVQENNLFKSDHSPFWLQRVLDRRSFQKGLGATIDALSPDLVISYDPHAFATMIRLSTRQRRRNFLHVWHCHEAPMVFDDMGWGTRRDYLLAKERTEMADLVIVPDRDRLANLFGGFNFPRRPFVVMNCPRHLRKLPNAEAPQALESNANFPRVLYIGSVGEGHGLEVAIESMRFWPPDAYFVIVGPVTDAYRRKLFKLTAERGHGGRVIVLGPVAADKALALRVGADLLLTIMDTNQPTYRYCAGASNKRFEAMAAGVAQVTNEGSGINELFVRQGVALAVKHDDVKSTGAAIRTLLSDHEWRRGMGVRARALHLERYNYEAEFAPVLEQITTLLDMPACDDGRQKGHRSSC